MIFKVGPAGRPAQVEWQRPKDFKLETVLPDGKGGLYLVSPIQVLHMKVGNAPRRVADIGSSTGAVALGPDGSLYLGRHEKVHRIAPDGKVSVVAEGFREAWGVAVDAKGVLYVSDWTAGTVVRVAKGRRKVVASGLEHPSGLVLDGEGNLFIKESGRQTNKDMRVRRLSKDGKVTLFATVPSVTGR